MMAFQVQTLIFPRSKWASLAEATEWATKHGHKVSAVDETAEAWRFQQRAAEEFTELRPAERADVPDLDERVAAIGGVLKPAAGPATSDDRVARVYPHVAARLFDQPLLVGRAKLEVLLAALGPRLLGVAGAPPPATLLAGSPSIVKPTVTGKVAVIPVTGTLVHRAFAVEDAPSGMTSYASIRSEFDAALEDPSVASIVFDIDSHGGEVDGCLDFVDHIYAARGKKPIHALVDHNALSAGYAIASAAEKIYVPEDGHVGSVGVCAVHVDQSKANQAAGLNVETFYVGERKNDLNPNEPLSDTARTGLMGELNAAYDRFVKTVARNRGITEKAIRETQAAVFRGEQAKALGLVDGVAPAMAALGDIVANAAKPPAAAPAAPAARPADAARPTAEVIELDAARREAHDRGQREAVAAERQRMADIQAIPITLRRPELSGVAMKLAAAGLGLEQARAILIEVNAAGSGAEIIPLHPKKPGSTGGGMPSTLSLEDIFARRRRDVEAQRKGG
jgi:capsid assembly protease